VNKNNIIDICLATYNGAEWIQDFLDSLDAQTYTGWRLVVSDDASNDGTLEIIRSHFINKHEKLSIVQRRCTGVGVVQNFQDSIEATDSEYILLADQDDVWQPEKLATLLVLMRQTEQDSKAPTLIFSDLEVVDEQLVSLNKSWWGYTSRKPSWARSFKAMLSQNIVPGCAMMLNRSLLRIAMPLPKGIIMHDWWFLLAALVFGKVGYTPERLVRYRRHTGAHTYCDRGSFISAVGRQYQGIEVVRKDYANTIIQAQAFVQKYANDMQKSVNRHANLLVLLNFIEASKKGWWQKRWLNMKNGIHLISILQTTKFYLWI
jgi:glycosyltransferase involved in cell wall biosynthesis